MASNQLKIAIIGGGLAGLAAAMKIAEAGHEVDLISVVPVKRSHSVCAQGGINGAVNTKGEGDSTWEHFDDTVYGGDFLANQPPVKAMCEAAPGIIYLLDRMGDLLGESLLDLQPPREDVDDPRELREPDDAPRRDIRDVDLPEEWQQVMLA